jgi:hypothetical protein
MQTTSTYLSFGINSGDLARFLAFVGSDADPFVAGPIRLAAAPDVADLVAR